MSRRLREPLNKPPGVAGGLVRRFLGFVLVWVLALPAAADPVDMAIREPRAFGHTVGDVLERRVTLDADPSLQLDERSLPKPGRVGPWIELREPELRTGHGPARARHEVVLTYQIVNAPRELVTLALPEVVLTFTGGPKPLAVPVPEFPFTASPLTPDYILARGPLDEMQPDAPPRAVPTARLEARLAAYAAAGGAILLFLAWRLWGLPFVAGSRGPFARACRDVARIAGGRSENGAREAIRRIHRAFDETRGRTVFAAEVPEFLAAQPRFAGVREGVERFFELSRREFFAGTPVDPDLLPWLVSFCRDCRDRERGLK